MPNPSVSGFTRLLKSETTYDPADFNRPVESRQFDNSTNVSGVQQVEYDAAGRVSCTAVRMNPSTWGSLPDACTAATTGGFGPDRIVQTAYDNVGRPVSVTSGLGTADALTVSTTYTDNGQVESLTDGRNNVSITEYDGLDRPVKLRYPNATAGGTSTTDYEAWTWNANSQPNTHRGRDGQTTSFTWDYLGRNTDVASPSGTLSTTAAFDNLGRRTSITGNSLTVNTGFDPLSRLTSESISGIGSMTYAYDAAGRMTGITWPDGFAATYDHNLTGATTEIKQTPSGGATTSLATYSYDDLGMLTGIARNGGSGASTTYGYDAFGRLSSLAQNLSGGANDLTLGYSYNPAGQIVGRTVSNNAYVYTPTYSESYTRNGLNQVTAINASSVTYDSNQNATGVSGNTYGYDAQGRLTSASAGLGSTAFVFDPLGRLHDSTVGGVQTVYTCAGAQLAAEYDSSGVMQRRYVPGLGLDDVVTSYVGSGTGTRSWQLGDERGSVVALSDTLGVSTQTNAYDEYGTPASGNGGRFQYTGQSWMPEAGAYNYRARTYLPQIGRFLQTDPIGYGGGQNLYAYVGLDPLNANDPTGLDPNDECAIMGTNCPLPPVEISGMLRINFVAMGIDLGSFDPTNLNFHFGGGGAGQESGMRGAFPEQERCRQNLPEGDNRFTCDSRGHLHMTPEYHEQVCRNQEALQNGQRRANDGYAGLGFLGGFIGGSGGPIIGSGLFFAGLVGSATTGSGFEPFGAKIMPQHDFAGCED